MNATDGVTPPATKRVTWYDTIIVGGGQAGLAAGHHLAKHDVDFVILDAGQRIGDSWRNRWDSLQLFTPARYSGLPGMPFPDSPMRFPDKDQVGDYLARYAERFDLPVLTNTAVTSLEGDGPGFLLRTSGGVFTANNVIVATGPFQRPRVPAMAVQLGDHIHQLHSLDYRSPFDLPEGPVLVVGAGNSGSQIAMELSRFRSVTVAGRSIGRLPRTILGVDLFRWAWPVFQHLSLDTWLGRRLRDRTLSADPLIGITPADLAAHRVRRVGRVTEVHHGLPHADGRPVDARVVIWATGFAHDFGWIRLPVFEPSGFPRHRRGAAEVPGLYFLGLRFQYRQSSALIGGVGADAEFIAADIARRD